MSDTREIDFGQSRRLEAQLAMRAVLGRVEREPFTGARLTVGQVAVEFATPEEAGLYYQGALIQHLVELGADVVIMNPDAVNGTPDPYPPLETLIVSGAVPGNALNGGRKAAVDVVEACAELARVLLANAVVAAAEDTEGGIAVRLRVMPEASGKVNVETSMMVGLCRIQGLVHCFDETRVSYLLGSAYGEPKARSLVWEFPLVEQIYGPNRLRWMDLRSPAHDPLPMRRDAVLPS